MARIKKTTRNTVTNRSADAPIREGGTDHTSNAYPGGLEVNSAPSSRPNRREESNNDEKNMSDNNCAIRSS